MPPLWCVFKWFWNICLSILIVLAEGLSILLCIPNSLKQKLTILHLLCSQASLLDLSTETTLVKITDDTHMAVSCGNDPSSPYLFCSGGFSTTDHSLFPKQILSLTLKIPYISCFPSKPLLSGSPRQNSSPLLDLKILKFLKPQSWTFFSIYILCYMISNTTC